MRDSWKSILRWTLLVVCGSILGINVYFANARRLVGNQLPMPFGYGIAIVLSGSMEPAISKDDLILVKEAESYDVDDIVVYQDTYSLVVHRIVEIDGENIITKGDANNVADKPIVVTDIKGKVIVWNSFAGKCVSFLKTPMGIICIIAAAIALIEIPHRKEKEKDDEERREIIDEIRRLKEETLK